MKNSDIMIYYYYDNINNKEDYHNIRVHNDDFKKFKK